MFDRKFFYGLLLGSGNPPIGKISMCRCKARYESASARQIQVEKIRPVHFCVFDDDRRWISFLIAHQLRLVVDLG